MTGSFLLDWVLLTVSLFNTILLFWLGMTVLLNAERHTWGIWLAGGGLLLGGIFFLSHSAILGLGLFDLGPGMNFWWRIGWMPVVCLPYAWYVVMLWYASYWDDPTSSIHRHHRFGLLLATLLAIVTVGLIVFLNALPSLTQLVELRDNAFLSVGGVPVLMLLFPVYLLTCLGLSLDALLRPGISRRIMGQQARLRARPWLTAATAAMLAVSLLVGGVIVWVIQALHPTSSGMVSPAAITRLTFVLAGFDLAIDLLIAAATLMVGQGVVAYEVFTGKVLPRHGLRRFWQRAIILAAGYSLVVSWALTYPLKPIYTLLLSTLLLVAFYALLSWRSYADRERYIQSLRPFVSSQRLYDQLLHPLTDQSAPLSTTPAELDIAKPFSALCEDLLGARLAYLIPLGPLAPLVGAGLAYPEHAAPELEMGLLAASIRQKLEATDRQLIESRHPDSNNPFTGVDFFLPLEPAESAGCHLAVPLWSERGRIGVLLLGEKRDGGLYTQEEIEIARAVGERLVDTQASTELARRLMALQRQRLAETQVIDQRTRRVLHDDVLPRLHTTLLEISSNSVSNERMIESLSEIHATLSRLLRELPSITTPEISRLGLFQALRQMIEGEFALAFDRLDWQIDAQAENQASSLSPLTAEVLFYAAREAVRNAAQHGRDQASTQPLNLEMRAEWNNNLQITISDNGVGITTAPSGNRGQGLALHSTLMAVIGGTLVVESSPGEYTRLILSLPLSP